MLTILWQRSLSLLLPSTCLACESDLPARVLAPELGLCRPCQQSVRWRNNLEYMQGDLEALYATAEFSGAFREAILHFKYQRRDFLATDFVDQWLDRAPYDAEDYDLVVAVPQSPLKALMRGYNPAEEIARLIARRQSKPWIFNALRRSLSSMSQTNKNKTQRLQNAKKGFRRNVVCSQLKGKSVLLVDDVCTTGATMGVCAQLLKQSGARHVLGAALARDMLS